MLSKTLENVNISILLQKGSMDSLLHDNCFFCYSEADLEDFINHLFHQAMSTEQNGNAQWQPPSQSQPPAPGWGAASAAKKARRRKKKH